MDNDWMIGVLKDLRSFAEMNGLEELAGKLGEATVVAKRVMTEPARARTGGLNRHEFAIGSSD